AVVVDEDLGRLRVLVIDDELEERVPVQRREKQIPHADEELDGLDVALARRDGGLPVFLDEERAHEAAAEVCEREALGLEVLLRVPDAHDEVDERLVRAPAVDRERGDARADDDREREEALADDLAQRLEASDPLADALEP